MTSVKLDRIAWAIHIACLFEVCADKPGNVTWGKDFRDARLVASVRGQHTLWAEQHY